jgi:hypothetical protein
VERVEDALEIVFHWLLARAPLRREAGVMAGSAIGVPYFCAL